MTGRKDECPHRGPGSRTVIFTAPGNLQCPGVRNLESVRPPEQSRKIGKGFFLGRAEPAITANVSTSPAIISDVEAGGHEWFMMNVSCQGLYDAPWEDDPCRG